MFLVFLMNDGNLCCRCCLLPARTIDKFSIVEPALRPHKRHILFSVFTFPLAATKLPVVRNRQQLRTRRQQGINKPTESAGNKAIKDLEATAHKNCVEQELSRKKSFRKQSEARKNMG